MTVLISNFSYSVYLYTLKILWVMELKDGMTSKVIKEAPFEYK